ncbi:carbohydrate ABC transporter permease [Cohnella faecalis]|nr:sugar ABC transporter permease [Cohnella faecalis]
MNMPYAPEEQNAYIFVPEDGMAANAKSKHPEEVKTFSTGCSAKRPTPKFRKRKAPSRLCGSRRTGRVLHRRSELAEYGPRHLLRQYGPVPSPTWIALGNAAQEYTFKGDADKSIDKFITPTTRQSRAKRTPSPVQSVPCEGTGCIDELKSRGGYLCKGSIFDGDILHGPITIIIFVFMVYPILQSVFYSLTDWTGIGGYHFVGFSNYKDIFSDEGFTDALKRTLFIGFSRRTRQLFRSSFCHTARSIVENQKLAPGAFLHSERHSTVVAAFVWRYILDSNTGLLNKAMVELFGSGSSILWLDSPDYVVYTIIFITVWQMWDYSYYLFGCPARRPS